MKNSYLSRKEEIILTTIDLMDELGIANVSIKEIAKREKVTDAALYRHFRSKEEIFLGVLEYYMKYDEYIFHTLREQEKPVREKVSGYFRLYAEYFENYPAITSILGMYQILLYQPEFEKIIRRIIEKRTGFLTELFAAGIQKGEFNDNAVLDNMVFVFMGTFEKIIYMWRLNRYQFSIKERTEEVIEELLGLYDKKI